MRRIYFILLIGSALQIPKMGYASEPARSRKTVTLPLVEVGRYEFPPANPYLWAISQDEKELFFAIDGEIRCFDRATRANTAVASTPGRIVSICLSRSSRYLAVCTEGNVYLITRSAADSSAKCQELKTIWTAAAFSANEDGLFGCAKDGFEAVDLKAIASDAAPEIRRVGNVAPDLVNDHTAFVAMPDNRFLVVGAGAILNTNGVAEVRDRDPIGSRGMYDLSVGPLHGNWILSFDQPITAKGKYMIMVVKHTKLLARTPDGRSANVEWDPASRVNWAQAVGDSSIWVQLYRDPGVGPLILRKYTVRFEGDGAASRKK